MSSTKLKEDLSNCLINFDRPVLITDLLENYELSYDEVNKSVQNYLDEQEKKCKFEKRYIVHGLLEDEQKKEIYKIVEQKNLKEWLKKLKNAESALYSVEKAGGAKSAASVFNPMRVKKCVKATRQKTKIYDANDEVKCSTASVDRKEVKQEEDASKIKESPKKGQKTMPKDESSGKKTSPKIETSPTQKKAIDKKASAKKGINNLFAASTATPKKPEDKKPAKGVVKTATSKKFQDFFKKQTDKPIKKEKLENPAVNSSVQLFEDDEPEEVESSDEEEKLEALKRDIISSDVEMEEESESNATAAKRRRIIDSEDEEEDPPVKQEKLEVKEETKEKEAVPETYLDEDGFVITKKPKQKATSKTNKSPTAKKTSPVTMKTPKETKKSGSSLNKDTKASTTSKTKQAGIMNFFSKK